MRGHEPVDDVTDKGVDLGYTSRMNVGMSPPS